MLFFQNSELNKVNISPKEKVRVTIVHKNYFVQMLVKTVKKSLKTSQLRKHHTINARLYEAVKKNNF